MDINGCSCRACNSTSFEGYYKEKFSEKVEAPENHEPEAYKIPKKSVVDRINQLPESRVQMDKLQFLIECNNLATEIDMIDEELHEIQKLFANKGYGEIALRLAKLSQRLN